MDINFYETFTISEYEMERIKRAACARYLENTNKNKELWRLCELGGFLIRNVNPDLDQHTYKNKLEECIKKYKDECLKIHNFVLRHITDNTKNMYFSSGKLWFQVKPGIIIRNKSN